MSGDLSTLVTRLESVTSRLEGLASKGGGDVGAGGGGASDILNGFDEQVMKKLTEFLDLSNKLKGEIAEQAKLVEEAFQEERKLLVLASKHRCPSPDVFEANIKDLGNKVNKVIQYCEKRRTSKVFNNLMTLKEGIGCVGWVSISPKPVPYVKECENQAQFYGNRVIKEHKGKNETHVSWVRSYIALIQALHAYVKEVHTTGLVWNKDGSPLTVPTGPSPSAGPPPPPPPAIQPPDNAPAKNNIPDASDRDRANLFSAINQGTGVTQGLRKVTDDMKTHKNPELRASSVVKVSDSKPVSNAPKYGAATSAKKPPVFELQGKKWIIEYQDNKNDLALKDTNVKQTVYIYKCTKSTLKVKDKVNSIIIDSCKRMALCFTDVISSVEVINSQGVQVQVLGKCPTVSIDKTDGCQVFLSKDSLNCEFISAKSSEMNISIPPKSGSGDYSEHPIPEQFKTIWNGTTLVTQCTDITS